MKDGVWIDAGKRGVRGNYRYITGDDTNDDSHQQQYHRVGDGQLEALEQRTDDCWKKIAIR